MGQPSSSPSYSLFPTPYSLHQQLTNPDHCPNMFPMHSVWNEDDRQNLLQRMRHVTPPRAPLWGTMNAEQMVEHVTAQLKLALGDIETHPRSSWLSRWPMRPLLIYWLPWPKGAPTVRELLAFSAAGWDEARRGFKRTFDLVTARGPRGSFAPHPVFGDLTPRAWGVLMYRHIDHHLRQFGL